MGYNGPKSSRKVQYLTALSIDLPHRLLSGGGPVTFLSRKALTKKKSFKPRLHDQVHAVEATYAVETTYAIEATRWSLYVSNSIRPTNYEPCQRRVEARFPPTRFPKGDDMVVAFEQQQVRDFFIKVVTFYPAVHCRSSRKLEHRVYKGYVQIKQYVWALKPTWTAYRSDTCRGSWW